MSELLHEQHTYCQKGGSNRRENEICEGLRQQVGDAGHASSTMHIRHDALAEWNTSQALRLDPPNTERSEGGQIGQELSSIREGKYWDDAKGGWLDPILVRKAREEEMQYAEARGV